MEMKPLPKKPDLFEENKKRKKLEKEAENKAIALEPRETADELNARYFSMKALRDITDVEKMGRSGGIIILAENDPMVKQRVETYLNELALKNEIFWLDKDSKLDLRDVKDMNDLRLENVQLEHSSIKAPVVLLSNTSLSNSSLESNGALCVKGAVIKDVDFAVDDKMGCEITANTDGVAQVRTGLTRDELDEHKAVETRAAHKYEMKPEVQQQTKPEVQDTLEMDL